jgi:CRP-like cAMP-binding protein
LAFESFNVEAGSFVIKQGENGDLFYVVESGALDIFVKTAAGEFKAMSLLMKI